MPTMQATVNGWRTRVKKTWYPTAGGWVECSSAIDGVNCVASSPVLNDGSANSGNMYCVCIKIATPNSSSIDKISSITIGLYANNISSATGPLYGSLRTVDTSYSTETDTLDSYRTYVAGNSAEQSASVTAGGYKNYTMTFTGDFAKNTNYYLYLYTKSTDDRYQLHPSDTAYYVDVEYTYPTYTVSYNANGHGTAPASQTKDHDVSLTLRGFISDVTSDGYTVSYDTSGNRSIASNTSTITYKQTSWNTNKSGTGTAYSSKGSYTNNSNATLYAIWNTINNSIILPSAVSKDPTTINYLIRYNANGGNTTPSNQIMTETRTYKFSSWSVGSLGAEESYSANATYTPTASVTMYANWHVDTVIKNGAFLASAINKDSIEEDGDIITLDANGGNCDINSLRSINTVSYTFKEWNTNSNGNGIGYDANYNCFVPNNITLYAIFNSSVTNKSSVKLPIPTKSGHVFLGWSTEKDSEEYVDMDYVPSANTTLYANYKKGYYVEMYMHIGGKWMNVLMP